MERFKKFPLWLFSQMNFPFRCEITPDARRERAGEGETLKAKNIHTYLKLIENLTPELRKSYEGRRTRKKRERNDAAAAAARKRHFCIHNMFPLINLLDIIRQKIKSAAQVFRFSLCCLHKIKFINFRALQTSGAR